MRMLVVSVLVACSQPAKPEQPQEPPRLLVANKAESTLSILELPSGRELARVPTGSGPHEVAVSPDGRRAVVSNYGGQTDPGRTLTVVDLAALAIERTVDLGELRRPHGIAFLDETRVLVTAEVNAAVAIVDVVSGAIEATIATGQQGSHMVALTPDKQHAYVANISSGSITPIDLSTRTAGAAVPAIAASEAIAVNGEQVWTASLQENTVVALDRALVRQGTLPGEGTPIRVYAVPDATRMLVTNVNGNKLQVVHALARTAEVVDFGPGAAPLGATVSVDSSTAYVALIAQNRVAVVDLATLTVTGHFPVGLGPDGIAYAVSPRS